MRAKRFFTRVRELIKHFEQDRKKPPVGLEPTISRLEVERVIQLRHGGITTGGGRTHASCEIRT